MKQVEVDVAVIGAGSAGLNVWKGATAEGARALMIDPGPLGTTCARVGCMPSKLLIAAAEVAHQIERAPTFGISAPEVRIDPVKVMERVRSMRDLFVNKTLKGIDRIDKKGRIVHERARLIDAHTIEAGDQQIKAKTIVFATGSKPWVPPPYRDLGEVLLTNEQIFELPQLPESMLVVGAGPIGLELGQAMARLGVRVTILDLEDRIATLSDPTVAERARALFGEELDMHLHHELLSVERVEGGAKVAFVGDDGERREAKYQYVLAATGRRPTFEGLNLKAAGLDPMPAVDPATGQIGDGHFFMAGDATGERMLLHEAAVGGRLAGQNAARYPDVQPADRKTALALVFTDPQVAIVGKPYSELDLDSDIVAGLDFRFQSRAKVLARDRGQLQLYADKHGKLLGAEILGPDAEHLGHLVAWVVQRGLNADEVLELPFYHPVVEEGLQSALRDISSKAR